MTMLQGALLVLRLGGTFPFLLAAACFALAFARCLSRLLLIAALDLLPRFLGSGTETDVASETVDVDFAFPLLRGRRGGRGGRPPDILPAALIIVLTCFMFSNNSADCVKFLKLAGRSNVGPPHTVHTTRGQCTTYGSGLDLGVLAPRYASL
jgi:hypothetical protein